MFTPGVIALTILLPTADLTAEDFSTILAARDAQLDNSEIVYRKSSQFTTKPVPTWKYRWVDGDSGAGPDKPETISFTYREQLVGRGSEATLIRELVDQQHPEGGSGSMLQHQKWSNTKGLARELTESRHDDLRDRIIEIKPGGKPQDKSQRDQMETEFALGFGFGKRITEIQQLRYEDGLWHAVGTIRIWPGYDSQSTFDAKFDDQLVLREAVVQTVYGGRPTVRFEITTQGSVQNGGLDFAETGRFQEKRYASLQEIEDNDPSRVITDFTVAFESFRPQLTDARYKELTEFKMLPGTQVMDRVAGVNYIVGQRGDHDF